MDKSIIGIGLDSCVIQTRHEDIHLVQTTDFFYPLVDDPYVQGRIACANVLSDLYAMGVDKCDNVLMLFGISLEMTSKQRHTVAPLLIEGFRDTCLEASTQVTGGQTVLNPWTIIGGVATAICKPSEYILPTGIQDGDVLVLTKPLGTQPAVNAHQWLGRPAYDKIKDVITPEQTIIAYRRAMHSMARLNRVAAELMHKYHAHGCTDVTGFGILGHTRNLAECQDADIDLILDQLPVIEHMPAVNSRFNFKLVEGLSAETSGGLLIAMSPHDATSFIQEIERRDGVPAWIIGRAIKGQKTARLAPDCKIVEVATPEL